VFSKETAGAVAHADEFGVPGLVRQPAQHALPLRHLGWCLHTTHGGVSSQTTPAALQQWGTSIALSELLLLECWVGVVVMVEERWPEWLRSQ
jgi:hypothetical protein